MQLSRQDLTPPFALRHSSSRVEPLSDTIDFSRDDSWPWQSFGRTDEAVESRLDESEAAQKGIWGKQFKSKPESLMVPKRLPSRWAFRFIVPPEAPKLSRRELALKWVAENSKAYAGMWVVLDGDRLLASGNGAGKVAQAARALGVKIPSIIRIPEGEEIPFAGW